MNMPARYVVCKSGNCQRAGRKRFISLCSSCKRTGVDVECLRGVPVSCDTFRANFRARFSARITTLTCSGYSGANLGIIDETLLFDGIGLLCRFDYVR